jgi:hypothetical protein
MFLDSQAYDTNLGSDIDMYNDCSGYVRNLYECLCRAQRRHFIRASDYLDNGITIVDALALKVFEECRVIRAPVNECMGDADLG